MYNIYIYNETRAAFSVNEFGENKLYMVNIDLVLI